MPRTLLPVALAVAAVLAVIGGFVVFQQFLAGDDVARLTLPPAATASPEASATNGPSIDPSSSSTTGTTPGTASAGELAGTWAVADGSVVGYRVREQVGGISALTDAIGRTSAVAGSATLEASGAALAVTAASFEADLTQLESDEDRRDNRIRTMGLESDRFPTGSFLLTRTIDVPADALAGSAVDVTLTGDLTIHGVTRTVSIPAQARLNGDRVEVVGALTFPFSDFDMTPPDVAGFVQVEDDATLEVLLSLART